MIHRFSRSLCPAKGFTLVEVMVAMAVVAVALPALLFTLVQQLDGSAYLRERTLASWVAANKLSELRLVVASGAELPRDELAGEATLAGRDWRWRVSQQATQLPGFTRVTISVTALPEEGDAVQHRLSAFMATGQTQ
jgi:general secretion pathway protein I